MFLSCYVSPLASAPLVVLTDDIPDTPQETQAAETQTPETQATDGMESNTVETTQSPTEAPSESTSEPSSEPTSVEEPTEPEMPPSPAPAPKPLPNPEYSTIRPNSIKWWKNGDDLAKAVIRTYGSMGRDAWKTVDYLLQELALIDEEKSALWRNIVESWDYVNYDMELNDDILPDGLNDTEALCIFVMGYLLMPDGTMQEELLGRMEVVLRSAEKYPNALILCAGGGTASRNTEITEASVMAQWLIENGIAPERIIIEDTSKTTAQNILNSCTILKEEYPDVTDVAVISSDYHVRWGAAEMMAMFALNGHPVSVVSNADYPTLMRNNYVRQRQMEGILFLAGYL